MAAETSERERLQRMSTNQHERFAVEPPEERKKITADVSTNQHEGLAAETPDIEKSQG